MKLFDLIQRNSYVNEWEVPQDSLPDDVGIMIIGFNEPDSADLLRRSSKKEWGENPDPTVAGVPIIPESVAYIRANGEEILGKDINPAKLPSRLRLWLSVTIFREYIMRGLDLGEDLVGRRVRTSEPDPPLTTDLS